MSVLEPPESPGEPVENPVIEEAVTVVKPLPPAAPVKTAKDVCSVCLRPVLVVGNTEDQDVYGHWNPAIDDAANPAFHIAELFVEPTVRWGHLDTKGKSEFSVNQGPSKVHSGWSGGGVA